MPFARTSYQQVAIKESFHVEKMNLSTTINPIREDGGMDHRFTGLTKEIVSRAGEECIKELSHLYQYTNDAEARYEKAGLTLVTSFFSGRYGEVATPDLPEATSCVAPGNRF